MKTDMQKLTERHRSEKNSEKRAKLKAEMDQIPVTSGELDQVLEREHDRHKADIAAYREARKQ